MHPRYEKGCVRARDKHIGVLHDKHGSQISFIVAVPLNPNHDRIDILAMVVAYRMQWSFCVNLVKKSSLDVAALSIIFQAMLFM